MKRLVIAAVFAALGVALVILLSAALPKDLALVLLDKGGATYPYSVQNIMWVIFLVGFGELLYRFVEARGESRELDQQYLPEDETKKASLAKDSNRLFLPSLIKRIITVFQTTSSVENASAVLNSSIELRSHDLDLRYSMIRYVMWVIPTFGFIGTVIGIALALNYAGQPGKAQDPELLSDLTLRLAVAFNTTLLALIMSSILVLILHVIQAFEERTINRCGQYCLDNLVNRLYKAE